MASPARIASAVLLGALCLAAAGSPRAQQTGSGTFKQSQSVWSRMDSCKREAFKKFPDYTPGSNAKRDQAVSQCLAASNLPPVAPLSPNEGSGSSQR